MDHIVLNVVDTETMLSFYVDVLELEAERVEPWRSGDVPFPSVRLNDNTIIDLFPEKLWGKQVDTGTCGVHLNHFCLALTRDAWGALQQRLESHAVKIDEGPVKRWGAHGTGTSVYFRDPENNVIEARYYGHTEDSKTCLLGS